MADRPIVHGPFGSRNLSVMPIVGVSADHFEGVNDRAQS